LNGRSKFKNAPRKKRKPRFQHTRSRFPERAKDDWQGPLIDYKEVELLRKFLTGSSKLMSRKRAGTSAEEQRALRSAVKHARFMALVPYVGA
jgi:small subunit ribosomal protein S18